MLWYSAGVGSDFDNWGATGTNKNYARYFPYWYVCNCRKKLDASYTDLYLKLTFISVGYKDRTLGVLGIVNSFYVKTTLINTVFSLALFMCDGDEETIVWSTPYDSRLTQVEVHAKSDTANGCIEIYINNVLVETYTGKVNQFEVVQFGGDTSDWLANACSECIITDTGRIGNKSVMLLPVNGRGSEDPSDYIKYIGIDPRVYDTPISIYCCKKGYTFLSDIMFDCAGIVSEFIVSFVNAGTYTIGIFTKTGTNTYKRKYFSDSIAIDNSKLGMISLLAGIDFPDNWNVTPQDTIGIFSADADLPRSVSDVDGLQTYNALGIQSNAFLTDAENTFKTNCWHPSFICKYYVDVSRSYEHSIDLSDISGDPDTSAHEKYRYCELSADGQEVNYNIANLQQGAVNTVDSIRIHADCSAGATLTNGKITLNVNGVVTESNVIPLTSLNTRKTFQIDKLLTASEINGALIGFKAYK